MAIPALLIVLLLASCNSQSASPERTNGTFSQAKPATTEAPPAIPGSPAVQAQSENITSLYMQNAAIGWALARGKVLRTLDGGQKWVNVTPPGASIRAATFRDTQTGLVTGYDSADADAGLIIYRTSDGGSTWAATRVPGYKGYSAWLSFPDAQNGWLMSSLFFAGSTQRTAILRTIDGGATWAPLTKATAAHPFDESSDGLLIFAGNANGLTFVPNGTGWAPGYDVGTGDLSLSVTHDGGTTWGSQRLTRPDGSKADHFSSFAPIFSGNETGLLPVVQYSNTGESQLLPYVTHDGGTTWSSMPPVRSAGNSLIV